MEWIFARAKSSIKAISLFRCSMISKTILITGCSSGIGHDAVFSLTKRGHRVIASCRKKSDVDSLKAQGIETLLLDISDSNSIQSAFTQLMELTNGQLDVLINNAGYGQAGALEDITRDTLRRQFETNVFGLLELTNLVIPIMRQQKKGRIINISSILGVVSMPFRGAYNSSKYAVEGLSDTLRLELCSSGIDVITIEPGPIQSQFRDNVVDGSLKNVDVKNSFFAKQYDNMLSTYKQAKKNSMFTRNPDAVIKKLIHAIESPKPRPKYPVTMPAHLLILLKRFLSTRMMDKLFLFISKKELPGR